MRPRPAPLSGDSSSSFHTRTVCVPLISPNEADSNVAVGRDVEVERDLAVFERVDLVEAGVGRRNADDRRKAVLVADAPDRLVGRVDDHVADARVLEQHALLAGVDVDRDEVAEGVIVLGIISRAGVRIEGDAGHLVEHHALDLLELGQLAGGEVHAADEPDRSGIAEGGDQAVGPGCRRSRAKSSRGPWG